MTSINVKVYVNDESKTTFAGTYVFVESFPEASTYLYAFDYTIDETHVASDGYTYTLSSTLVAKWIRWSFNFDTYEYAQEYIESSIDTGSSGRRVNKTANTKWDATQLKGSPWSHVSWDHSDIYLKYTAVYTVINYNITYTWSGGGSAAEPQTYNIETDRILHDTSVFTSSVDGSVEIVFDYKSPGEKQDKGTGDIEITVTQINYFVVKFDLNGGKLRDGKTGDSFNLNETVLISDDIETINPNLYHTIFDMRQNYTVSGFVFNGWGENEFTTTPVTTIQNTSITDPKVYEKTLYAIWSELKLTVQYYDKDIMLHETYFPYYEPILYKNFLFVFHSTASSDLLNFQEIELYGYKEDPTDIQKFPTNTMDQGFVNRLIYDNIDDETLDKRSYIKKGYYKNNIKAIPDSGSLSMKFSSIYNAGQYPPTMLFNHVTDKGDAGTHFQPRKYTNDGLAKNVYYIDDDLSVYGEYVILENDVDIYLTSVKLYERNVDERKRRPVHYTIYGQTVDSETSEPGKWQKIIENENVTYEDFQHSYELKQTLNEYPLFKKTKTKPGVEIISNNLKREPKRIHGTNDLYFVFEYHENFQNVFDKFSWDNEYNYLNTEDALIGWYKFNEYTVDETDGRMYFHDSTGKSSPFFIQKSDGTKITIDNTSDDVFITNYFRSNEKSRMYDKALCIQGVRLYQSESDDKNKISTHNIDYTICFWVYRTAIHFSKVIIGQGFEHAKGRSLHIGWRHSDVNGGPIMHAFYADDADSMLNNTREVSDGMFHDFKNNVNEWVHLSFTYNKSTRERITYFNGKKIVVDDPFSTVDPQWTEDDQFFIGDNGNEEVYIEDLRIYSRVLNQNEINHIYNRQHSSIKFDTDTECQVFMIGGGGAGGGNHGGGGGAGGYYEGTYNFSSNVEYNIFVGEGGKGNGNLNGIGGNGKDTSIMNDKNHVLLVKGGGGGASSTALTYGLNGGCGGGGNGYIGNTSIYDAHSGGYALSNDSYLYAFYAFENNINYGNLCDSSGNKNKLLVNGSSINLFDEIEKKGGNSSLKHLADGNNLYTNIKLPLIFTLSFWIKSEPTHKPGSGNEIVYFSTRIIDEETNKLKGIFCTKTFDNYIKLKVHPLGIELNISNTNQNLYQDGEFNHIVIMCNFESDTKEAQIYINNVYVNRVEDNINTKEDYIRSLNTDILSFFKELIDSSYSYNDEVDNFKLQEFTENTAFIDDFRIYNRFINTNEINSLFLHHSLTDDDTPEYTNQTNMIGWYKFDGNYFDSSGNKRHLIYKKNNAYEYTLPYYDAENFIQGSHSITSKTNYYFQQDSGNIWTPNNMTISFFMYGGSGHAFYQSPISARDHLKGWSFYILPNSTTFQFICGNSSDPWLTTNYDFADMFTEEWKHIVFTLDSSNNFILYINGQSVHTHTFGNITRASTNLRIGCGDNTNPSGNYWLVGDAKLDDIRIYRIVLTQSEIFNIYSYSQFSKKTKDMLLWYRFDSLPNNKIQDKSENCNNAETSKLPVQFNEFEKDSEIYEYIRITDDAIITFKQDTICDILVVGGGGAGGNSIGGGGGAGGVVYTINQTISAGTYSIGVGAGGTGLALTNAGQGTVGVDQDGKDSYIKKSDGTYLQLNMGGVYQDVVGKGGGAGAVYYDTAYTNGRDGGSGGGSSEGNDASTIYSGGSSTQPNTLWDGSSYVQGGSIGNTNDSENSIYQAGGGGGAGGQYYSTSTPSLINGKTGVQIDITGASEYYAAGGGGGQYKPGSGNVVFETVGLGGNYIGGNGRIYDGSSYLRNATSGVDGTGSGGGGGAYTQDPNDAVGSGGSGIVIIRWKKQSVNAVTNVLISNEIFDSNGSQYLQIPSIEFSEVVNGFSTSFWVYFKEDKLNKEHYIIDFVDSTNVLNNFIIKVNTTTKNLSVDMNNKVTIYNNNSLIPSSWNHIVFSLKNTPKLDIFQKPNIISCGNYFTIYLDEIGNTYAYGDDRGQPPTGKKYVFVACGLYSTIYLDEDGNTYRYGFNFPDNKLGAPPAGNKYVFVACGDDHTIYLDEDGNVYGLGTNLNGQRNAPPAGNKYVFVACGKNHTVYLDENGDVYIKGPKNAYTTAPPVGNKYVFVACREYSTIYLDEDGNVYIYGYNTYGKLDAPPAGNKYVFVACGYEHTIYLDEDGNVYRYGSNDYGETDAPPSENKYVYVACGAYHTVYLDENGNTYGYGRNNSEQRNVGSYHYYVNSRKLYVNNEQLVSNTNFIVFPVSVTYDQCYIGKSSSIGVGYLKGNIQDLRFYNRSITQSEINELYDYNPGVLDNFGIDTTDMLAWYEFNENLNDSSGNDKHATGYNDPVYDDSIIKVGTYSISFAGEDGVVKNIYSLTGTNDDYLIIPGTNFSTYDGISVSLWIKWESLKHYSRIFRLGNGDNDLPHGNSILMYEVGTTHDIGVEINNNGPIGGSNMKATFTYKNFIVLNTWTHIVLSVGRYPNTLYLYKNGVLQSPNDDTKGNQVVWLPDCVYDQCFIGKSNWSQDDYLHAQIFDFIIYTKALKIFEVKQLYDFHNVDYLQNITNIGKNYNVGIGYDGGKSFHNHNPPIEILTGGGGGGIGGKGLDGRRYNSNGGPAKIINITGVETAYGGGGGGGGWGDKGANDNLGGGIEINGEFIKVGGDGKNSKSVEGDPGVPHTGSGGGSGKDSYGGSGGSGVVIIRWTVTDIVKQLVDSDDIVTNGNTSFLTCKLADVDGNEPPNDVLVDGNWIDTIENMAINESKTIKIYTYWIPNSVLFKLLLNSGRILNNPSTVIKDIGINEGNDGYIGTQEYENLLEIGCNLDLVIPKSVGYEFQNWVNTNNEIIISPYEITEAETLEATWIDYTISTEGYPNGSDIPKGIKISNISNVFEEESSLSLKSYGRFIGKNQNDQVSILEFKGAN